MRNIICSRFRFVKTRSKSTEIACEKKMPVMLLRTQTKRKSPLSHFPSTRRRFSTTSNNSLVFSE